MAIESRHDVCINVTDWAREHSAMIPELRSLIHIPNVHDAFAAPRAARKCSAEFFYMMPPGLPDFMLPVPVGVYAGMFVMVTTHECGGLVDPEYRWLDELHNRGYYVRVCRDSAEVIDAIKMYLENAA